MAPAGIGKEKEDFFSYHVFLQIKIFEIYQNYRQGGQGGDEDEGVTEMIAHNYVL